MRMQQHRREGIMAPTSPAHLVRTKSYPSTRNYR